MRLLELIAGTLVLLSSLVALHERPARTGADDAEQIAEAVRRALEEVGGAPERERGEATLEGLVIARDGTPIVGANVGVSTTGGLDALTRDRSWLSSGYEPPGSDAEAMLEAAVGAAVSALRTRRQRPFATTDADGRFAFTDLVEAGYRVQVYAEGYRYESTRAYAGDRLEVTLERVRVIEVEPRLPDGSMPERAVVYTGTSNSSGHMHSWDPANREIPLDAREETITVLAGEVLGVARFREPLATLRSNAWDVDLAGEAGGELVLDLEPRSILRVRLDDREPAMDNLPRWVELRPPGATSGTRMGQLPDGRYAIEFVEPGTYHVAAGRGQFAASTTVSVELDEGLEDVVVTLPALDLSEHLVVRCVGPSGDPVIGAELADVTGPNGAAMPLLFGSVERPCGVHWVPAGVVEQRRSRHADGALRLTARSGPLVAASVEVPEGTRELELRFEEPCALTLVTDTEHSVDIGVLLRRQDDASADTARQPRRMMQGSFDAMLTGSGPSLTRISPGPYRLYYYVVQEYGSGYLIQSMALELESGERTVELQVPELSTLLVTVPGATEGMGLRLQKRPSIPADIIAPSVRIGENGVAAFTDVPAGVYSVSIHTSAGRFDEEILVPSEPVTLTPR